ncbi:hypothetical protein EVAR_73573_1 [Eumeta japonica]|uniref:Uncharacterized protein n=1 Tax=Eumeta variegata TaxID=151549 RepID=A0A4C1TU00_EUMVA|nr:hypothetical protein EVAR_73573_1 [Eumeta japonica]
MPPRQASSSANTSNATTCTIASTATALTSAAYSSSSSNSSSHQTSSSVSSKEIILVSAVVPRHQNVCMQSMSKTPLPLDLYQRRLEHQHQEDTKENSIVNNNNNTNEKYRITTTHLTSGTTQKQHSNSNEGGGGGSSGGDGSKKREDLAIDSTRSFNSPDRLARHDDNRPMDESIAAEVITSGRIEKIEDDDVEYGDEEMELDDDGDNNSEDESSGHSGGSGGGIEGGIDSARLYTLAPTIPLTFDAHTQRPASRSSREGSGLDRPSSRGGGLVVSLLTSAQCFGGWFESCLFNSSSFRLSQ